MVNLYIKKIKFRNIPRWPLESSGAWEFRLKKELNFDRLQNWKKIVRPRVKFFEPIPLLALHPTGTFPNWYLPQLALLRFLCHWEFWSPNCRHASETSLNLLKSDIYMSQILISEKKNCQVEKTCIFYLILPTNFTGFRKQKEKFGYKAKLEKIS